MELQENYFGPVKEDSAQELIKWKNQDHLQNNLKMKTETEVDQEATNLTDLDLNARLAWAIVVRVRKETKLSDRIEHTNNSK